MQPVTASPRARRGAGGARLCGAAWSGSFFCWRSYLPSLPLMTGCPLATTGPSTSHRDNSLPSMASNALVLHGLGNAHRYSRSRCRRRHAQMGESATRIVEADTRLFLRPRRARLERPATRSSRFEFHSGSTARPVDGGADNWRNCSDGTFHRGIASARLCFQASPGGRRPGWPGPSGRLREYRAPLVRTNQR